ncbi:unnamed protein product [Agarophyton chilense]
MNSKFAQLLSRSLRTSGRTLCSNSKTVQPHSTKIDSQDGVLQFIDSGTSAGATRTGRAWRTSELRLKSYEDLHKLWFILLKERNVLLTEKAWCKTNSRYWVNGPSNLYKVKRSMARLKGVIGERTRAYKAKRAREALRAEQEDVGLGEAMLQSRTEGQCIKSRTVPPS